MVPASRRGEAVMPDAAAKVRRGPVNSSAQSKAHDYRTLRADVKEQLEGGELIGVIERMKDTELRALLEGWEDKSWLDVQLRKRMNIAVKLAAAELFKRQGIPALEWAEQSGRREMFSAMVEAAACREPKVAREWVDRLAAAHGRVHGDYVSVAARQAARMRGSSDLLEIEQLYNSKMFGKVPEFADGFDFTGYMRNSADEFSCRSTLRYLAAADPEAAAQFLKDGFAEKGKVDWLVVGAAALDGRASMTSEEEATRWIGELAGMIDEGRRGAFTLSLGVRAASDERIGALIKNLPEDQDRLDLAQYFMLKLESEGKALTALRAMDSESLRVRALERRLRSYDPAELADPAKRSEVGGKFEALMENLQMSDSGRQQVRALLPEAR